MVVSSSLNTVFHKQVLLVENERLRFEVRRLKFDNGQLVKKTKDAESEKNRVLVLAHLS